MSATPCGVPDGMFVATSGSIASLIVSTKCTTGSVSFGVCTAKSGWLTSNRVVFTTLLGIIESFLGSWCFLPARWTTVKLNKYKQSCFHRASRPELSYRFKIHLSETWSVRIVNRILSRYGRGSTTAQIFARNFICVA